VARSAATIREAHFSRLSARMQRVACAAYVEMSTRVHMLSSRKCQLQWEVLWGFLFGYCMRADIGGVQGPRIY
jgi:hypothetical protein